MMKNKVKYPEFQKSTLLPVACYNNRNTGGGMVRLLSIFLAFFLLSGAATQAQVYNGTCETSYDMQQHDCSDGEPGMILMQSDFTCPARTWGPWYEVYNDCPSAEERATHEEAACSPRKQTRRVRCPKNMNGYAVEQSDFKCPQAEWGGWYQIVNKCVRCQPYSKTRPIRCPGNQIGQIMQKSDFQCPAGKWSGWYQISSTCRDR